MDTAESGKKKEHKPISLLCRRHTRSVSLASAFPPRCSKSHTYSPLRDSSFELLCNGPGTRHASSTPKLPYTTRQQDFWQMRESTWLSSLHLRPHTSSWLQRPSMLASMVRMLSRVVQRYPLTNPFSSAVVVEKPFCPSSKECDELIALAKEKAKILTVFQNRRWDSDFVTLKRTLAENKLGRVVEFESHYDRYDPVVPARDLVDTPGSGVVYDLGTHLFDQILNIYGPPAGVTGFLGRQRERTDSGGPFDACSVLLHYSSGLLATVKASPMSADDVQLRFWVRGSKGSYKKVSQDTPTPRDSLKRKNHHTDLSQVPCRSARASAGQRHQAR